MYRILSKVLFAVLVIIIIVFGQAIAGSIDRDPAREAVREKETEYYQKGYEEIVRVSYVIDGDTFDLADGRRVRLIGIDARERGDEYYKEATDFLKRLIEGREVLLRRDVSETDKYGRLLRYVFMEDVFINEILVREGYATTFILPPDVAFTSTFREAQRAAQKEGAGLWSI